MNVADMWKSYIATKLLLIVLNLALFSLGNTPWTVLGLICLAVSLYVSFRQGMGFGHNACSLLEMVEHAADPHSPTYGQVDRKVASRAWSVSQGVRGMLVCALPPYLIGCVYIVASLLNAEAVVMPARLVSWIDAMPFWPVVLPWYQTFDRLTGVVAAVLMISPFILPGCLFAGYLQGPKL